MDDNRKKALAAALGQIEKQFGKGSVMRLGDSVASRDIEVVSTGSLGLDVALGVGGLPKGRIIEIYGPEASGKTTMTLQAVAECQKAGGTAAFVDALAGHARDAAARRINLALETDLAPGPFAALLERFDGPAVTVNYDSGNSASLGFNPTEEFDAYGHRITDIHLKDRTRNGGPVVLSEGDCDFDTLFALIASSEFDGPLVMQAFRDDEGVTIFARQQAWLRDNYTEILQ